MENKKLYLLLFAWFFLSNLTLAQNTDLSKQEKQPAKLFRTEQTLSIKWTYSSKDIKQKTNDSTYIESKISYKKEDGSWESMEIELRARGNFRRANCYFTPLKLKIKKSNAKGTVFKGNKKLKLVLPCRTEKNNNDKLIKEYLAYKLYELISPYHFKTRLVDIDFTELRGKKTKSHALKGILVEDDKNIAERFNGNVLDINVHPLSQNDECSVRNDFFQFLIGNTDYSTAYQHNQKLLFIDKKIMPVPYDFDMSGLVDASYSVVSKIQNNELAITKVTQRLYRGFKRDEAIYKTVRNEFLKNESKLLGVVHDMEPFFSEPKEFESALKYVNSFYKIISDDKKFQKSILDRARTK